MNDTAEVYLWGTRIGIIHQDISKAWKETPYAVAWSISAY